ncbi:unnamed protein product, partial [Symbiodinium sp. KB8]
GGSPNLLATLTTPIKVKASAENRLSVLSVQDAAETRVRRSGEEKMASAWGLEFEAEALAAQGETRFLQAEIHRLLAERASEQVATGRSVAELEATIAWLQVTAHQLWSFRQVLIFCCDCSGLLLVPAAVLGHACAFASARFWSGRTTLRKRAAAKAFASFDSPIRRLEFNDSILVGAGYDLVDVRVLTTEKEPVEATFMLDSGLTTNLVSPAFLERLGLETRAEALSATALGGSMQKLRSTDLPGLELLGSPTGETYAGLWQGGGWRAWCTLDWDAWKAAAAHSKDVKGEVMYEVLPSEKMTESQLQMVGWRGTETVQGTLDADSFSGRGISVEPKGVLSTPSAQAAAAERAAQFGHSLIPLTESTISSPGPLHATCVEFAQAEIARQQGIELHGMLGQLPLHQDFLLDVDPEARRVSIRVPSDSGEVATQAGLRRIPGLELPSRLLGVEVLHAPQTRGFSAAASQHAVAALLDSGSANSVLNWPAAELLLGLRPGDRVVRDAPRIRAIGVGGGAIDMPLLRLSLGLVTAEGDYVAPQAVRVALGDAEVFADIFGREESGSWPLGLGPKPLKPAALIGQDILSQQRHLLVASEPALYVAEQPASEGELHHVGEGDCIDDKGRRLAGLQKLGCTMDDAAWECLSLPPGTCAGIAVTPNGRFQGLCYIFVGAELGRDEELRSRGFSRYEAPAGQTLASSGSTVATADGTPDAQCFRWQPK